MVKKIETWLEKNWKAIVLCAVTFYLATHLFALTKLPVFADEAIYIRWTQLMIEDFSRYAFFPLNDGKTPLHMWLMIPFVRVMADPLFAGRLLSVFVGLVQMLVMKELIQTAGGKKLAQFIGVAVVMVFPFWFFHHRMALIDGLLTLFLSITLLGLMKLSRTFQPFKEKMSGVNSKKINLFSIQSNRTAWMFVTGISFGLALITKLPGLFFAPIFILSLLLNVDFKKKVPQQLLPKIIVVGLAGFIGIVIFLLLKLHPAFGQLFGRGNDFTFTTAELLGGQWVNSLNNIGRIFSWHGFYMSFPVSVFVFLLPLNRKRWPMYFFLLISCMVFIAPYVIFARVLAPRYVFPMVIFTTMLLSLLAEEYLLSGRRVIQFLAGTVLATGLLVSVRFIAMSYLNPDLVPFPPVDRMQYLEEWSSGHGMIETTQLIEKLASNQKIWVMTEGYFGTLPDALLMYFYNRDVTNVEIQGVGGLEQDLPDNFFEKVQQFDKVLLVVNSHRFKVKDTGLQFQLLERYPRPNGAPSLDVYELITQE